MEELSDPPEYRRVGRILTDLSSRRSPPGTTSLARSGLETRGRSRFLFPIPLAFCAEDPSAFRSVTLGPGRRKLVRTSDNSPRRITARRSSRTAKEDG